MAITKTRKPFYKKPLTATEKKFMAAKTIIYLYTDYKPRKARRKMIKKAGFIMFCGFMERINKDDTDRRVK